MELVPGLLVDQYRLEASIGNGASGEVWRASDGVQVAALKFMNKRLLQGDEADLHYHRFQAEVRALEDLEDVPHIPQLYGYNTLAPRPYFAMTYIDSPAWSEQIYTGEMLRVPVLARLDLLEVLAHTLTRIHKAGYIHRDVKPANLHGVDHPYLIDFSVASDRFMLGEAEDQVGTGVYMPPLTGEPPDERFDYFAFALVAYEVLFGFHAVFSPAYIPGSLDETRAKMGEQITARAWHWPSQLSDARLPGSLRGADLAALDRVFDCAFRGEGEASTQLSSFVASLRAAVSVPTNAGFIDYVPEGGQAVNGVPSSPGYTHHEVRKAKQQTQHPPPLPPSRRRPRRKMPNVWMTVLLALLGFLAILFFVFSLRTP